MTPNAIAWTVGTVSRLQSGHVEVATKPPACGIARRCNVHMAATPRPVLNAKSSPAPIMSPHHRQSISDGKQKALSREMHQWMSDERDFGSLVDNYLIAHGRVMPNEMRAELLAVECDREDS